ncbi:hypothetical protein ACIRBX_16235 [Kitasatospora sp. NPDC096147]|uniref:hypothetical protein n=1 Tax=Kitasatospora sp. NPDC096147 TaxID=3364093 RepID=UPI00380013F4
MSTTSPGSVGGPPEESADTTLYEVWHARHLAVEPDGTVIHHDPDGSLHTDQEEWRMLGLFSSEAAAEAWVTRARLLPGFREEPDCFVTHPVDPDQDSWTGGYFTYYSGGDS